MKITDSVTKIKGVGEKTAALMAKIDIFTVQDLLHTFPKDYDTFGDVCSISTLKEGQKHIVCGSVIQVKPSRNMGKLYVMNVVIRDQTGMMLLTFFNQPYLKNKLLLGHTFFFRGMVQKNQTQFVMEQPSIYTFAQMEQLKNAIWPKYHLTKGLSNHMLCSSIQKALAELEDLEEILPKYVIEMFGLCSRQEAYQDMHFPKNFECLKKARERFVFEELFLFVYMIRRNKGNIDHLPNDYPIQQSAEAASFIKHLPYALTNAQLRTWKEISADMASAHSMNRLIQGDVGSGKTIIALLALLQVVVNGYQGALMAPTEVLARQHMESFEQMTLKYDLPFRPVLLVGSMTSKQKKEVYEKLQTGRANLVIGTHAVIQEKVVFQDLALVVTDEQHRFGVRQRETLAQKGTNPHVMVMSATPIPRSLAIILYGDMHLSVIDELPANRLARKNCVVGTKYRNTAYKFIQQQVEQGHQAYVICPMVEPSEEDDDGLENVITYSEKIKRHLKEQTSVAYLHGKMRPNEKNAIMQAFIEHKIDVLVSTTVIEVGINVPNATVMMVENAERFGLAGLHQLRGRVGRGDAQSYCIFVSTKEDAKTMERLEILNRSNDGFFIANEDLRLRGPGDLFGVRQSGEFVFELADVYQDAELLKKCSQLVDQIMQTDPFLEAKEHETFRDHIASGQWNGLDFRTI